MSGRPMASFFLAPLVETHRVLAGLSGVNLAQDLTGAIKKQKSPQDKDTL